MYFSAHFLCRCNILAYGMMPRHASYGAEIVQTLIDNVTTEEFKGRLIIVLAGYEEHVTELFETNAGFQSRFDKMRVYFPPWSGRDCKHYFSNFYIKKSLQLNMLNLIATGAQAASAVIHTIRRENKHITEEAESALASYFETYSQLPNWASARDAMDIILPQLESERAQRSYEVSKQRRQLEDAEVKASGGGGKRVIKGSAQRAALPPPIPYELADVQKVFAVAIQARGGDSSDGPPSRARYLKIATL